MTRPGYAELSVLLSQVVQQGGKRQTQIVAWYRERLAAENPHLKQSKSLGGGGGGGGVEGGLDLIVNYLDKIRSF